MNRQNMVASTSTTPAYPTDPRQQFYQNPHLSRAVPPFVQQNHHAYDHHRQHIQHHHPHHQIHQHHQHPPPPPPQQHQYHQQQQQQQQAPPEPPVPQSKASTPTTTTHAIDSSAMSKYFRPYFTPSEIDYLSEKQRGKQTVTQEDKARQGACAFIESMGFRLGFPRRTTCTAQALYHRFHLFFPRKEFSYHEVALATLYVSSKMHDTLKKPRDLLSTSYAIRFPELAAKSKHPGGEIDIDNMDPQLVENDRQRLLTIERLVLETICFNFKARMAFPYVFKLGKQLYNLDKPDTSSSKHPNDDPNVMEGQDPPSGGGLESSSSAGGDSSPSSSSTSFPPTPEILLQLAWRLSVDSYRTLLPLIYPPHTIALGSIYTAALLQTFERPPAPPSSSSEDPAAHFVPAHLQVIHQFSQWSPDQYYTRAEDLDDIAHTLLDLLIQHTQNPSANTSPSTPSSPSPHQSSSSSAGAPRDRASLGPGLLSQSFSNSHSGAFQQVYKSDQLIRLKIALRQNEKAQTRVRKGYGSGDGGGGAGAGGSMSTTGSGAAGGAGGDPSEGYDLKSVLAQSEGTTTRFLFFPPGMES